MLNVHRYFRGESMTVAVNMGAEPHPVVVNICQALFSRGHGVVGTDLFLYLRASHINNFFTSGAQRHDLKPTGISECEARPVHKFCQPAVLSPVQRARLYVLRTSNG